MNMYFDTRKEAREFCKHRGIVYSKIKRNTTGACSWYVAVNEVTRFEKNKVYKIADEAGFVKPGQFSQVNIANKIQLEQIKKHLPDGFKIIELDHNKQSATFEAPVGVSFNTIRFEEARYAVEVTPVAVRPTPDVAPNKQPEKVTLDVLNTDLDAELDSELDGGVSLADTAEKEPTKFVPGQEYILVDRNGFLKTNSRNKDIMNAFDKYNNGIYKVRVGYDSNRNIPLDDSKIPSNVCNYTQRILHDTERKFFREYNPVPVVVTTEDIRKNKLIALIDNIEVAKTKLDKAKENYSIALDERNKALDELTVAFKALSDFVK